MENKTTQGLGNKKILSFPKHDSLKYWRLKSDVNNHMSIQYENQSESLSWSFSDLSFIGKWCLQRDYMCRQHEIFHCRKLHNQLSNSCHRSGKGHVWQLTRCLTLRRFPRYFLQILQNLEFILEKFLLWSQKFW
jgi:hypothetical protein